MTKHTPTAGAMPNASIDFNKVHDNARAGKENIFKGAVHEPKKADEPATAPEPAPAAAPAKGE